MFHDLYGLPLSTAVERAAVAYNEAMALLYVDRPGADQKLADAIEADPHFALALAASARLHRLKGRTAEASSLGMQALAAADGSTAREASHVKTLHVLASGNFDEAVLALRAHLQAWPLDFFVLSSFVQHAFFFGGRAKQTLVLSQLAKAKAEYGDDPRFLSRYAFHLQEAGRLDSALRLADQCLNSDRDNGFAAHAKAHVFFARGQWEEAFSFLDEWTALAKPDGPLYAHMLWHRDLALIEMGRMEEASANFERLKSKPYPGPLHLALADDVGFLWRARIAGDAKPPKWIDKTRMLADALPPSSPFNAVHIAFLHAYDANPDPIAALRERAVKMPTTHGGGADGVVDRVLAGLELIARGNWEAGSASLAKAAPDAMAIGGSNFERSLIRELAGYRPKPAARRAA